MASVASSTQGLAPTELLEIREFLILLEVFPTGDGPTGIQAGLGRTGGRGAEMACELDHGSAVGGTAEGHTGSEATIGAAPSLKDGTIRSLV